MTAREFENCSVTMRLAAWLASASAADKANMENKATYDHANREDKEKKTKIASDFIKKTTGTPLLKMEIASIVGWYGF